MAQQAKQRELKNTGYELFILLLSLVSIMDMVLSTLATRIIPNASIAEVVAITDMLLTTVFMFDFSYRIFTTSSKRQYFFKNWGWADLLACIPMLRIFRLFRIVRAARLMRTFGLKNMINEVLNNRAGSALYLTVFAIIVLAETAAILVLEAERANPNANIVTRAGCGLVGVCERDHGGLWRSVSHHGVRTPHWSWRHVLRHRLNWRAHQFPRHFVYRTGQEEARNRIVA